MDVEVIQVVGNVSRRKIVALRVNPVDGVKGVTFIDHPETVEVGWHSMITLKRKIWGGIYLGTYLLWTGIQNANCWLIHHIFGKSFSKF